MNGTGRQSPACQWQVRSGGEFAPDTWLDSEDQSLDSNKIGAQTNWILSPGVYVAIDVCWSVSEQLPYMAEVRLRNYLA